MKNITKIILGIILLLSLWANSTFALRHFLPEYDEFRNLNWGVVNQGYEAYKKSKLQEEKDTWFTGTDTQSGAVQIKTVFDFYNTKRSERIDFIKKEILSRIEDRTLGPIGDEVLDSTINKLQEDGKYFVIKAEWEIIPIDSENLIYLYEYDIKWKENLIDIVREQVQRLQTQEENINFEQRNNEINNIVKTLDRFKIKYIRLKQYREWKVFVWRGNGIKVEWVEYFFINKLFTTPELNTLIDERDKNAIYFWTYIPKSDFKIKYFSNNDGLNNDVFVDLLGDAIYAGNVKKDQRVYLSTLYPSTQDKFIYSIQQSRMEYVFLALALVAWLFVGAMMVFNFINNFRANFKKTPEEL